MNWVWLLSHYYSRTESMQQKPKGKTCFLSDPFPVITRSKKGLVSLRVFARGANLD